MPWLTIVSAAFAGAASQRQAPRSSGESRKWRRFMGLLAELPQKLSWPEISPMMNARIRRLRGKISREPHPQSLGSEARPSELGEASIARRQHMAVRIDVERRAAPIGDGAAGAF